MVAAMGGLYSILFHMDLRTYLPFLALSLVLWNAMGGLVGEACAAFTQAEGTIRSVRMPFFVHAIRTVIRSVISLLHNIPVIVVVFAIFGLWPGFVAGESLVGIALWTLDAFAACLLLGAFCARFRDVPPIRRQRHADRLLRHPHRLAPRTARPPRLVAALQPVRRAAGMVRQPLLGQEASWQVWGLAFGYSAVFCALAWAGFARVRARLAYWM